MGSLLSVIKDICSKSHEETFLCGAAGASVVLASASAATTAAAVAASTAMTSASSSAHISERVRLVANMTIRLQ
jgi:hypothetical protein